MAEDTPACQGCLNFEASFNLANDVLQHLGNLYLIHKRYLGNVTGSSSPLITKHVMSTKSQITWSSPPLIPLVPCLRRKEVGKEMPSTVVYG